MEQQLQIPVFDVLIVGAGLSGICAAYHLQDKCEGKSFQILEARESMGGTWDLFKYPGIRSDSDMYTLGYSFNPWKNPKAIADGPSILAYIKETAAKFGIDKKIRYGHKVVAAEWLAEKELWHLELADGPNVPNKQLRTKFLFNCAGYYNYDKGHTPKFEGSEAFQGRIIHPQKWDTTLDYSGKKVVVIGSGATAVTLVPEMAKKAEKVTMLQRSPSYIMNLPSEDVVANFSRKIMPLKLSHSLVRWKNVLMGIFLYKLCRRWPERMRKFFKKQIEKELGDQYEEKHFDPKYKPWDQRLCLIPDNDLFEALKTERAEMVTDTIARFTEKGILLDSGKELEADIIVTATGLKIQVIGGVRAKVNGKAIDSGSLIAYKGVMFSGIPNMALAVGYTNASWTLKCELNCLFVCKILNHMDKHGYSSCIPRFDHKKFGTEPLLDFDANYIKRSLSVLPRQGSQSPWKVYQNYVKDTLALKYGKVDDKYLVYH